MRSSIGRTYRGLFTALTLGALGFGAAQALASPEPAVAAERCTWEMNQYCIENCQAEGYGTGKCVVDRNTGVTVCECF